MCQVCQVCHDIFESDIATGQILKVSKSQKSQCKKLYNANKQIEKEKKMVNKNIYKLR